MFDSIESLNRVAKGNMVDSGPKHFTESVKRATANLDQVDVSQEGALDTFHNQISSLKTDLPGMLASAMLAPANAEAVRSQPLNEIVFRLTDPLSFILRGGSFTKEQLDGFQKEVSKFRNEILGMRDSEALAPVIKKVQNDEALNKILFSLTSHLDGVLGQIQDRIMNA